MESYKAVFLIVVAIWFTFTDVQATSRAIQNISQVNASSLEVEPPVSAISAVPATAPAPISKDISTMSPAPGPTQEDINIDFNSVTNVEDLAPKFDHINKFDFSSMKIDTTAKDVCKDTDHNNECLAAILPDIQKGVGEGKSGLKAMDIMRMQTESLFKKANATLDYAKRVVEDNKTEMPVKEAMSVCVENYDSLISSLEDARTAMDGGNYGRLESVMSAAISDLSTCSDAFTDVSGVDSPTASLDELMKKLCSNILAMSQKIKNR